MMPVRESLTFECMLQFELWLYAMGATKRAQCACVRVCVCGGSVCGEGVGTGKEIKGRRRGSVQV